jgi:hypothetical protein
LDIALSRSGEDSRRRDPAAAMEPFRRGCDLGLEAACRNLNTLASGNGDFTPSPPTLKDFPTILRGSKGEVQEREPSALYALACRQGWSDTCEQSVRR